MPKSLLAQIVGDMVPASFIAPLIKEAEKHGLGPMLDLVGISVPITEPDELAVNFYDAWREAMGEGGLGWPVPWDEIGERTKAAYEEAARRVWRSL